MSYRGKSKPDLLKQVTDGLSMSRECTVVTSRRHPFQISLRDGNRNYNFRIHISDCTPLDFGQPAYCPQNHIWGPPKATEQESQIELVMGWHNGYALFLGFDAEKRAKSQSTIRRNSLLPETLLLNAHTREFALTRIGDNELVFTFQPYLICDYAFHSRILHQCIENFAAMRMLERFAFDSFRAPLDEQTDSALSEEIYALRCFQSTIRREEFRVRVLSAYGGSCAFCESKSGARFATYIVPASVKECSEETTNGIALCEQHHGAFESGLVYIEDNYCLQVNSSLEDSVLASQQSGGLRQFTANLKSAIHLPADRRFRPKLQYIQHARQVRGI